MRSAVTSTINTIGSIVTITPYTLAAQTDLGYGGQIETAGTPVSETAIPFEETKGIIKEKFGNLEKGQFQLALKYTATFDITGATKYKMTWQSEVYDVASINRYSIQDVLVAWIITLSKRFD